MADQRSPANRPHAWAGAERSLLRLTGIEQLVMVGDRGMISSQAIDELRESDGITWNTALKSASIRALVEQGHPQLDLFDKRNLLELDASKKPAPQSAGQPKRSRHVRWQTDSAVRIA